MIYGFILLDMHVQIIKGFEKLFINSKFDPSFGFVFHVYIIIF